MARSRCGLSTSGMLGDPWFPVVLLIMMIVGLIITLSGKASACGPMHKQKAAEEAEEHEWDPEDEECEGPDGCDAQFPDFQPELDVVVSAEEFQCPAHHDVVLEWSRLPMDGNEFLDFEILCLPIEVEPLMPFSTPHLWGYLQEPVDQNSEIYFTGRTAGWELGHHQGYVHSQRQIHSQMWDLWLIELHEPTLVKLMYFALVAFFTTLVVVGWRRYHSK